jgi:ubiquinone/menaquinone biosynthesis C-methylase UbiE
MRINFLHILLRFQSFFSRKMYLVKPQFISFVSFEEPKSPILDLGGGGAGVIGQLYQNKVTAVDLRQSELDDTPNGPVKICADARDLPFENHTFQSVTAFYFFMYVNPEDFSKVIREAYRTLVSNGSFYIWDSVIPKREMHRESLFAVPILVTLPKKTIQTAYGVKWENHFLDTSMLSNLLEEVGFEIKQRKINHSAFYIECRKRV